MLKKGTYRHYKGKNYEVIGHAIHTETGEYMAVYSPHIPVDDLPPDTLFVRPLSQFLEEVDVDGTMVPRFKKI